VLLIFHGLSFVHKSDILALKLLGGNVAVIRDSIVTCTCLGKREKMTERASAMLFCTSC